eukprot:TRINITY_DN104812_c0_g1_i1.p1 TRINITY_DN104812_c0_g1~~TRINITY_DN104812_c0_g1_i1.p1  ORF type:complete len:481 (+),score=83.10 TRINITY_DN104812_c0_g1_i1:70-1443(+)
MSIVSVPGPKGLISAIEYAPAEVLRGSSSAFVLLLPGTSIRPGPGAEKAAKYRFETSVPGIYKTLGTTLASQYGLPVLQLCWRHFPADGGVCADAMHDIFSAVRFMRERYGFQCGAILVGFSFGGAAIQAALARCQRKGVPPMIEAPQASSNRERGDPCAASPSAAGMAGAARSPWLLGCVALAGALKGPGDDTISLQDAAKYMEDIRAPLLIVHGSADDNVAPTAACKLFRLSPTLKSLCMLDGADHDVRDPYWRDLVTDICIRWLRHMSGSRGTSTASRSRAIQRLQHLAAADLCELSLREAPMKLAFDPAPQRLEGGGLLKYDAYEVPTMAEISAFRKVQPSSRTSLRSLEGPLRQAALEALCSVHVERCQKARERQKLALGGHMRGVYERFKASRDRREQQRRQELAGTSPNQVLETISRGSPCGKASPVGPLLSPPCRSPSPAMVADLDVAG